MKNAKNCQIQYRYHWFCIFMRFKYKGWKLSENMHFWTTHWQIARTVILKMESSQSRDVVCLIMILSLNQIQWFQSIVSPRPNPNPNISPLHTIFNKNLINPSLHLLHPSPGYHEPNKKPTHPPNKSSISYNPQASCLPSTSTCSSH